MKKVELLTERLLLRAPVMADVAAIAAACQDSDIQRWVPIPVPYRESDAESYVRDYSGKGWESGSCCTWAIVHDGLFAGAIGLDGVAGADPTVGYWMVPASRRAGLLSEALHAVLDFGLSIAPHGLGLDHIGWHAYAGNSAPARVARKAGFRFEGTLRDGAAGREGLEDGWVASIQRKDARMAHPWDILPGSQPKATRRARTDTPSPAPSVGSAGRGLGFELFAKLAEGEAQITVLVSVGRPPHRR